MRHAAVRLRVPPIDFISGADLSSQSTASWLTPRPSGSPCPQVRWVCNSTLQIPSSPCPMTARACDG